MQIYSSWPHKFKQKQNLFSFIFFFFAFCNHRAKYIKTYEKAGRHPFLMNNVTFKFATKYVMTTNHAVTKPGMWWISAETCAHAKSGNVRYRRNISLQSLPLFMKMDFFSRSWPFNLTFTSFKHNQSCRLTFRSRLVKIVLEICHLGCTQGS